MFIFPFIKKLIIIWFCQFPFQLWQDDFIIRVHKLSLLRSFPRITLLIWFIHIKRDQILFKLLSLLFTISKKNNTINSCYILIIIISSSGKKLALNYFRNNIYVEKRNRQITINSSLLNLTHHKCLSPSLSLFHLHSEYGAIQPCSNRTPDQLSL